MIYRPAAWSASIRHGLWLLLFSLLLTATTAASHREGMTALSLALALSTLATMSRVLFSHGHAGRQLTQALRALANMDASMKFPQDVPLQHEFNRVRERILRSRSEVRSQANFLRSLLTHLDASIIVLDDAGNIIHKNPAADRLLGPLPNNTADPAWGTLGRLFRTVLKPARTIVKWRRGEYEDTLSVNVSFSRNETRRTKIVSIQSIRQALEAKEQSAYKQLTRVLTHEVANSIMPITSLANTAKTLLPQGLQFADEETKVDLEEALLTLSTRASHLNHFIDRFTEVSGLPPPQLQRVDLHGVTRSVLALFEHTFRADQIHVDLSAQPGADYWVMADPIQIEQALVNLVINAVDVLKSTEEKCLSVSIAFNDYDQLTVDVRDSGPGIEPYVRDRIFVPFFTTKPTGSGIGLSLARQIMIGHGGDLLCIDPKIAGGDLGGAHFRIVFS